MDKKGALVRELHKPARRNYKRRQFEVRGIDETWQADLVDMTSYSKQNGGFKFLLTVIDIFSKFAWAIPIKSKNGADVTNAMKSVLKDKRIPKNLHVDQGKEFYNKDFMALMKKHGINMYSTFSGMKASICERFNRTLKTKMWLQFSLRGSYKWTDILPDLLATYNRSKHRTIQMKPSDVTKADEQRLLHDAFHLSPIAAAASKKIRKSKFRVGDKVRISKYKHIFEKGYTPNWTTEIFTIVKINNTRPITYKLSDYQDSPIEGNFYQEELAIVKHPDIYLIEKILRQRGDKVYVKWLGFDNKHNSWIKKSDM